MAAARLWFGRLALAYAAVVCTFLGYVYFVAPTTGLAPFGVTLSGEPHSVTFIRTGLGAFFVSQWLVALWGLVRPGSLRTALGFLVLVNSCVVAGRLLGLALDGTSPMQWSEVRTEGLSWLLFVAALLAVPRDRAAGAAGGPALTGQPSSRHRNSVTRPIPAGTDRSPIDFPRLRRLTMDGRADRVHMLAA